MAPTEHLNNCPYIREIMTDLGAVWGRSRLMGLAPSADVPEHVDVGYYWRTHLRIHIPIVTTPKVLFTCDGTTVHMAAGECWAFDSFCLHNVRNAGADKRIHLVLDTVGGEKLWDLMTEAREGGDALKVDRGSVPVDALAYERNNAPEIMSAWEVRCHIDFLVGQTPEVASLEAVVARINKFASAWAALWAQYGVSQEGLPHYSRLIETVRNDLKRLGAERILLGNNVPLYRAIDELVFMVAAPAPPPGR